MTHGVLSLADFLGLRLDHAGEVLGREAGDGVGGPVNLDVGDGGCPILCVRRLGLQVIRESVGVRHS